MLLIAKPGDRLPRRFTGESYTDNDGNQLVGTDLAWCREIATESLAEAFYTTNKPGAGYTGTRVDLHGVRAHKASGKGYEQAHLTKYVRGKPSQPLAHAMHGWVYLVSAALDLIFNPDSSVTTEEMATITVAVMCQLDISNPINTDIYLNAEAVDGWTGSRIGRGRKPYGSLTDLPVEWVQSRAVMSYLMYIPRLWGGMCKYGLGGLTRNHTIRDNTLTGLLAQNGNLEGPSRLALTVPWRGLAKRLIIPTWYFNYGRARMWAFTYHLFHMAYRRLAGEDITRDVTRLCERSMSGFENWMRIQSSGTSARTLMTSLGEKHPIHWFPQSTLE